VTGFPLSPAVQAGSDHMMHFMDGGYLFGPAGHAGTVMALFFFILLVLSGVVLVLWAAMPFSVFGLKSLLRRCIAEQEKTNALLERLIDRIEKRPPGPPGPGL